MDATALIRRQNPRQYGWAVRTALGTRPSYLFLLPLLSPAGCPLRAQLVALERRGNIGHPLRLDHTFWGRGWAHLTVIAYGAARPRGEDSTSITLVNLVMTTMIGPLEALEETRTELTLSEWIVHLYDWMTATTTYNNPTLMRYFRDTPFLDPALASYTAFVNAFDGLPAAPDQAEKTAFMLLFLRYFGAITAELEVYTRLTTGILSRAHNGISISILGMFAKAGSQTPAFVNKMKTGAPEGTFQELIPGGRTVARAWNVVTSLVSNIPVDVQDMFANLNALIPMDVNLRVSLTLQQAAFCQAGPVVIAATTARKYPNCPVWSYIHTVAPGEYAAWENAMAALAANPFAAVRLGNQVTTMFEARQYQNLGFAAVQLEEALDRNSSINGYAGRFTTIHAGRIMQIINDYVRDGVQNYIAADYVQGGVNYVDVADIIPPELGV